MPRTPKARKVKCHPASSIFKPAGIPKIGLSEVVLTLDEFEAVRLADFEGLYQDDAAGSMDVSRQTFGNILVEAHRKIADCLVNGKALRIEGGIVDIYDTLLECGKCLRRWPQPDEKQDLSECPACGSADIGSAESIKGTGHGMGCKCGCEGKTRGRRQFKGGCDENSSSS